MFRALSVVTTIAGLLGRPVSASGQQCAEGVVGSGQRARRAIVETVRRDSAILHLFTRPLRHVALSAATDSRLVAGDSAVIELIDGKPATITVRLGRDTLRAPLTTIETPPAGRDVIGEWTAAIGPGGVIRLVARIAELPCGAVTGVFDSPDQGQRDLPFTAARFSRDSIVIAASYLGLEIALPVSGGDRREARFTQGGLETRVSFVRGAASILRRPQEPTRPFPYVEREVRFRSRSLAAPLAGTLTLPPGVGPHPAVVLISGSGAQDRDETVAGHKPFLVLSDHLTRKGYAVLRFDDRRGGMQITLEQTADDAEGAVAFLRTQNEIDTARIGLLGHSEGGYVAPLVAVRDRRIAFLILFGAPTLSGHDVFQAQATTMLRASGATADAVRIDSLIRATVFAVMRGKPADELLETLVDSAITSFSRRLPPDDRKRAEAWLGGRTAAQDSNAFTLWRSPWFKSLFHHDAVQVLRAVDIPVLAVYGALDLQVPPAPNLASLERVFRERDGSRLTTHLLPGVNHMMQPATSGGMEQYRVIEQTLAQSVLDALDGWFASHVPVAHRPRDMTPNASTTSVRP